MSKVQTLLKIIAYQKEHPEAKEADILSIVGISEQYLAKCKKEIQELLFYFSGPLLSRGEVDILLSKLDPGLENERAILDKLQRVLGEKDGLIRIASPEDKPSKEYLQVGLWTPRENKAHVDFWLGYLLYDTLLWADEEGNVDYRLASSCENIEGYSKWRVKLKKDLHWSDGKPITPKDVIDTIAKSRLAPAIREVKKDSREGILFTLARDEALFPYLLNVPILPSHSPLYDVTSGSFLLKKSKSPLSFHLYRNKDYYRTNRPKIDWISLKTFNRFPFAVRTLMEKNLDILPLRSLHQVHQWSSAIPQSLPFRGLSYYLLLINKEKGLLADESEIHQLKESIDYNAISLYLSASTTKEIKIPPHLKKKKLDLKIGYLADMPAPFLSELALLVASSLGTSALNVFNVGGYSSKNVREAVDIILTQLYFGYGYSGLRRYFHSKGGKNILGFNYPEVDSLIEKLDKTASMEERKAIGQEVVRKLREENAIILLVPCFEYVLSNLYIVPSPGLGLLTDLILNLSNIYVKRGRVAIGSGVWTST